MKNGCFLLVLAWCAGAACNAPAPKAASAVTVRQGRVRIEVHYGRDSLKVVDSVMFAGDSASVGAIMTTLREKGRIQFAASADAGGYMTEIDGKKGINGKFWWLCVNDTSADVGFFNKFVRSKSKISWYLLEGEEDGCKTCYCGWKK